MIKPTTIDEYIASCPAQHQEQLELIRSAIKEVVPDATEKISWNMPTFVYHGPLAHFMLHKNHIGFYPFPSGVEMFLNDSSKYKTGKGSIQFPLDQPLPLDLIRKVIAQRAEENKQNGK